MRLGGYFVAYSGGPKPSLASLDIPIRDSWPYTCRRPSGSESMFQKAFRDDGTIWSWGLKLNWSSIMLFRELEQVYLGMENSIRSSNDSPGWDFWNWPLYAKFALGLTDPKKPVSHLVQWDDLLAMDKLRRGIPIYNSMLRLCWNWLFFYLSYRLGIMASWKSLAKGI